MIPYKLKTDSVLSKSYYQQFNERNIVRTVKRDGTISIDNHIFFFADRKLRPGTKVKVQFGMDTYYPKDFNCYSIEEVNARFEREFKAREEAKKIYNQKLCDIRKEAEEFNKNLILPVKWSVKIKGERKKNTIFHICLEEDYNDLKKGGLLCNTPFDYLKEAYDKDGNGDIYNPKITCKECLRIYKSLKKK